MKLQKIISTSGFLAFCLVTALPLFADDLAIEVKPAKAVFSAGEPFAITIEYVIAGIGEGKATRYVYVLDQPKPLDFPQKVRKLIHCISDPDLNFDQVIMFTKVEAPKKDVEVLAKELPRTEVRLLGQIENRPLRQTVTVFLPAGVKSPLTLPGEYTFSWEMKIAVTGEKLGPNKPVPAEAIQKLRGHFMVKVADNRSVPAGMEATSEAVEVLLPYQSKTIRTAPFLTPEQVKDFVDPMEAPPVSVPIKLKIKNVGREAWQCEYILDRDHFSFDVGRWEPPDWFLKGQLDFEPVLKLEDGLGVGGPTSGFRLEPGESDSVELDLGKSLKFFSPGKYTVIVKARFQVRYEKDKKPVTEKKEVFVDVPVTIKWKDEDRPPKNSRP